MSYRLPLDGADFVLALDPPSPDRVAQPEAAFWLRMVQGGGPDWQGGPAEDETWALIGVLDGDFGLRDGVGGPERWLQTTFQFAPTTWWAANLEPEAFFRALHRLLAAWPAGRKCLESDRGRGMRIWLGVVPEFLARPGRECQAEAVAATALWNVLGGLEACEAIRWAHADPWEDLLHAVSSRAPNAVDVLWPLDTVPLPPALAWVHGTVLGECWRRGELLDGFQVEPLPDSETSALFGFHAVGPLPSAGNPHEKWLPVIGLNLLWFFPDPDGTAIPLAIVPYRKLVDPPGGRPAASEKALAAAMRAWPAGKKALLIPRSRLLQPGRVGGPFALAAVRLGTAAPEDMAAAVEMAAHLAAQGVPDAEIARWVAGLKPDDLAAVAGMQALAI